MKLLLNTAKALFGGDDIPIMPGDSVDLGDLGLVVWLVDEDAAAWRLVFEKRAREINAVIAHVKGETP
jgi:hypothetical protein